MKLNLLYILSLIAGVGILFSSCASDDDIGEAMEPVAVQFGSGNIAYTRTTSGGTLWTAGDPVGIYMVKQGQQLSVSNIAEGADNVHYKAQTGNVTNSGFTPVSTIPIYYPQNGDKVDFVAYYPYKPTGSGVGEINNYIYPVDVRVQTTPADIDVLYAKTVGDGNNYSKDNSAVDLKFDHALSRIVLNIKPGAGMTDADLVGVTATIKGMPTTVNFSLTDGSFGNLLGTGTAIEAQTATPNATFAATLEAIVIPQASGTGRSIDFTRDGKTYTYTLPDGHEFIASKQHTYEITVYEKSVSVSVANITPWGEGGNESGTATCAVIGDYYYADGTYLANYVPNPTDPCIGIVFRAKTATQKGLVVSLNEGLGLKWSWDASSNISLNKNTNARDNNDGMANMSIIKAISGWESNYPAFKWCSDKGADWYLPALDELKALYAAWNGGSGTTEVSGMRATFNGKLTTAAAAGGTIITPTYYWSSSEITNSSARVVFFDDGNQNYINKSNNVRVRCVLAF